ncbi:uncharacterized protein LOC113372307 isoform X2 [Ctenocephalides felis]|nr:uncharacterized protein LOC113372307 isoform X2 [Ctenocephalides felis]
MTCPMRPIGSGADHCPYDWLSVFDGRDDQAPLIGTFCGMGKFPHSIIGTSQHLYVEFVSSPAGPLLNTGFHFNVGNWPGHVETAGVRQGPCDWLLSSDSLKNSGATEGIFLSVAHWYPPDTTCSYHIQGRPGEIVRLYFPSFRINRVEAAIRPAQGDCAESLTLYDADGPDDAKIIKTFCDTFSRPMEKVDFVSSGRSLFVRFESKTGSYSGSSLYYWAHYDFFNDTRWGIPVPNSVCDETFPAWRVLKGKLRSPLNSLVYKRAAGSDVRCRYRFVTDKRLFSRVVLDIVSLNFKDHPYSTGPCTRCMDDRVDKLMAWEGTGIEHAGLMTCLCTPPTRPIRLVSSSDQLTLEMLVQGSHAAASYFKHNAALFEARYEFVHGPLCGPISMGPTSDGELVYPYRGALGLPLPDPPRKERCIWTVRVAAQRDLWLHLDKARFAGRSCDEGRIEIALAGRAEPRFIVCGENISVAKDLPILSAAELGAIDGPEGPQEPPPVTIQYSGDGNPSRVLFRLVWTELYHLPRNADGTLATSKYTESGDNCEFACPGGAGLCIPTRLVCNGEENCPNTTSFNAIDTRYIEDNLKRMGLWQHEDLRNLKFLTDESPAICNRRDVSDLQWLGVAVGAALGAILAALCLVALCKACRRKRDY